MRSLLLGGGGFIGSALARRLVAEGHAVTVVDDFSRGARDRLPSGCRIIPLDVRLPGWRIGMRNESWDWLFGLAGVVGVPNVVRAPFHTWEVTTETVRAMLEIPAGKMFFASTSEIYGGQAPIPTSEAAPASVPDLSHPRAVYAVAKMWGEVGLAHSGRPYVLGRFHNVYGPRMGQDHVIPLFCAQLLKQDGPLHVDDPTAVRAFCYVDDAVEAIVRLMEHAANATVNIGNPEEPVTMLDLMTRLRAVAGQDGREIVTGGAEGFPRVRQPEIGRLVALTGFQPRVGLDEGLARTFAAYAGDERREKTAPRGN